ncbi:right-handed parallel beta-helix repeat-containing protein [Patescibacteria group bacterium]|nr:right-handed parallel beta-helix repeat-containing protein [Patescibacteria group bacterium]
MPNNKSFPNIIISLITLILPITGIIYLTVTIGVPLLDVATKIQETNLLAGETVHEQFRPLNPPNLLPPQLVKFDRERQGQEIGFAANQEAREIDQEKFIGCTINLSSGTSLNNSQIENSVLNIDGLFATIQNSIIKNTHINIRKDSIATITNSLVQGTSIDIDRAQLAVEKSTFIDNSPITLFSTKGNTFLRINNTIFENNTGQIITTQIEKNLDKDGNEIFLIPQIQIENSSFDNNSETPITLTQISLMGTKLENNIFSGGSKPYIQIKDSPKAYIVIKQNYFKDQGIVTNNSDHIIICANKFENLTNYAAQLINSNLVAFQYNTFANISPAGILTQNTPQIELVHNEFNDTEEIVKVID